MMKSVLAVVPFITLVAFAGSAYAQTAPAPQACQYILGFKTLHDLDATDVGDCLDNQAFAGNGDAQEHTAKGLMVWRKADNWTAFTNGYQTWINGPDGLVARLNTQRFPWEANPDGLPLVGGAAPSTPAAAGPAPAPAPDAGVNPGVTFGKPVVFATSGVGAAAVLATNPTGQVVSFAVKATFVSGGNTVATASGSVNDLKPNERRAAVLSIYTGSIPATYDSVNVTMDKLLANAPATPAATAASKLSIKQVVSGSGSGVTVIAEVKNDDTVAHSVTVQAAFLKGGELLAVGSGGPDDVIPAGQSKRATFDVVGNATGYDTVLMSIDGVQ